MLRDQRGGLPFGILLQKGANGFQQFSLAYGLYQIRGNAKLAAPGRISHMAGGSEHHDRCADQCWVFANQRGECESVHVGHLAVEQNQRKGMAGAFGDLERLESGAAALDGCGPHAPACEHSFEDAPVSEIVVNDQDMDVSQPLRRNGLGPHCWKLLHSEANNEVKGAALTWEAFQPNAARHQFDQALADGQSQSCAAVSPSHRTVGLREGFENLLLLFDGHTDTSIPHGKMEEGGACLQLADDVDGDFTLFGKLDGIADQIDQDLADASGIADQSLGKFRVHVVDEFDSILVRAKTNRFHRLAQALAQIEGNGL